MIARNVVWRIESPLLAGYVGSERLAQNGPAVQSMILYPSGESKTGYQSPPWATIVWIALSLGCYFWFVPKFTEELETQRKLAKEHLIEVVAQQFKAGKLDRITWIHFNEDPSLVVSPDMLTVFPEEARIAWIQANDPTPPLMVIANKPPRNLLLIATPHHLILMLVGCLCLVFVGFLLEHLYDPLFVFATYLVSGSLQLLSTKFLPESYQPSILFAWAHGAIVVMLFAWMISPKATLTVSLRGWFIRSFGDDFQVPSYFFPLFFSLCFVGFTLFNSPYAAWIHPLPVAVLAGEATVLALMFIVLPTRAPARFLSDAEIIARDLAEAELRYANKDLEAGHAILHRLAKIEPDRRQMRAIAELAWRNDEIELAKHCYLHLIRKANVPGESSFFVEILNEILFRRMPISGTYLVRGMNIAIETMNREQINKLMPYLLDHPELKHEEVIRIIEKLAGREIEQREPDRLMISQLQDWFMTNAPESEMLDQFTKFFQGGASESSLTGNFAQYKRLNRLVDVDLIDILPDKLIISIKGQKEQRVPWTALVGIYGCHISQAGYRGCIVIQFQRKVFGCVFTSPRILFQNRAEPVTFERVWEMLGGHAPEDIPFMNMKDFPTLNHDANLMSHVETFVNPD